MWRAYLYLQVADGEINVGINASMVYFDGLLFVPLFGADLLTASHPSFYILDATNGGILKKTTVIPRDYWLAMSGGGIWGTGVVDTDDRYLYVGTANPYNKRQEHPHTNSIVKIDMDRSRYTTFGEIVGNHKGDFDYDPELYNSPQCVYLSELIVVGYSSFCGQTDADFGASPILFTHTDGRTIVGGLQRAPEGTFHAVDAQTMQPVWTVRGTPGSAATPAFDGERIFARSNTGTIYAIDKDTGDVLWTTHTGDVGNWSPLTVANGVVYAASPSGNLQAYDAQTGEMLLNERMVLDGTICQAVAGGGVTVARNTVYVACDGTAGAEAVAGLPIPATGIASGPLPGAVFAFRL